MENFNDPKEVIKKFCELSTMVMEEHFECDVPADCFCEQDLFKNKIGNYGFSGKIMEFIYQAVVDKIRDEKINKKETKQN